MIKFNLKVIVSSPPIKCFIFSYFNSKGNSLSAILNNIKFWLKSGEISPKKLIVIENVQKFNKIFGSFNCKAPPMKQNDDEFVIFNSFLLMSKL